MRIFSRAGNHLRHATSNKLIVASAFMLLLGAAAGLSLFASQPSANAAAGDCSANSIIKCGSATAAEFASDYQANEYGDLAAVYAHYGLSQNELDRFKSSAKMGTAYKDGRIVVDGKTVATNASSLGRQNKSGDHAVTINGKTYYEGSNQTAFNSDSIPVLVMFDDKGEFEFGVLTPCANPVKATPVKPEKPTEQPKKPVYTCDSLTLKQISRTEYTFTVTSTGSNGATVQSYAFNFGDSTTQTYESTNASFTTPTHTYAAPGTYTVVATANFKVNDETREVTSDKCRVKVTVPKPNEVQRCDVTTGKTVTITEEEAKDTDRYKDVDAPECQPVTPETPPSIPSTGPAEMVGAAAGVSSLTGAGYYWVRSRRDLISSILKK